MSTRILYLASNNKHKQEELAARFAGESIEVRLASELADNLDWDECGQTFEENARIKALAVKKFTNLTVLADDSGLEVHALDNKPGIHSSRYAGDQATDTENYQKLLKDMLKVPNSERTANFTCCLLLIDENGDEHIFNGECHGEILPAPRGAAGFGYDPVFYVPEKSKTMAELRPDEKNAISHRAKAVDLLLQHFKK